MTSLPANNLVLRWSNSPLASRWARQGSKNILLQYVVVLEDGCKNDKRGYIMCSNQIANTTVRFGRSNKAQFSGLTIGVLYQASIWASNTNGTSPTAATKTERLAGPPGPPHNVHVARWAALQAVVMWELPLDTGDRTRTRSLVCPYDIAEILASPSSKPVNISSASTSIYIEPTMGGSFRTCAPEGSICTCIGAVVFGASGIWSPPVRPDATGTVLCVSGPLFPDLTPESSQKECQCNSAAQVLKAGQFLSARILAVNSVGQGNFSLKTSVRIMGNPSPIRSPTALEKSIGIVFSWLEPADTGFGIGDSNATVAAAAILSYKVVVSDCHDFSTTRQTCVNNVIHLKDLTKRCSAGIDNTPANCSLVISEAEYLYEGGIFYI
jgi:hypothetical protein